ncbi:MAG: hypothetical protein IJU56_06610 [Clostridia bacterium]|nr:hypothetical protein [Clostridia bacterium]
MQSAFLFLMIRDDVSVLSGSSLNGLFSFAFRSTGGGTHRASHDAPERPVREVFKTRFKRSLFLRKVCVFPRSVLRGCAALSRRVAVSIRSLKNGRSSF